MASSDPVLKDRGSEGRCMQRRQFLTGVVATGAAVIPGCSGPLGESDGRANSGFGPSAQWAVAPAEQARSYTGYRVETFAPERLRSVLDRRTLMDLATYRLGDSPGFSAIEADSIEQVVHVDTDGYAPVRVFTVFQGSFEAAAVVDALGNHTRAWSDAGNHSDYELYAAGSNDPSYAIRDGILVEISYPGQLEGRDALETVLDTGAGEVDRLQGRHEGFQLLVERLDPGVLSNVFFRDPTSPTEVELGRFHGTILVGSGARLEGGTWHTETVRVFRDASEHSTSAISEWLDRSRNADSIESLQVERDGRVLHIETVLTERPPFGGL